MAGRLAGGGGVCGRAGVVCGSIVGALRLLLRLGLSDETALVGGVGGGLVVALGGC